MIDDKNNAGETVPGDFLQGGLSDKAIFESEWVSSIRSATANSTKLQECEIEEMKNQDPATSLDAATLIHLHKLGFKLLSLSIDNEVVVAWTRIYENPDYWSAEKLIAECSTFKNVATVFGKSHVKDEKGLDLYLNGFDCDSEYVNQILNSDQIQDHILRDKVQNLISKTGSKSLFDFPRKTTVVVKTRK